MDTDLKIEKILLANMERDDMVCFGKGGCFIYSKALVFQNRGCCHVI